MDRLQDQKQQWMRSITEILRKPSYALLAIAGTYLLLSIASWLPNRALLSYILRSGAFSIADKFQFLLSLRGLTVNATNLSLVFLIATALLTGINLSLITYYFKTRATLERAAGVSTLGIIGSLLGIGCASCGSVILTSIFGFAASTAIIGALPFKGLEFAVGGFLLVGFSTYILAKKIARPVVC